MSAGSDLIAMRDRMLAVLSRQQSKRNEYRDCTWLDAEISVMHYEVNVERSKRGLTNIDRSVVVRVEQLASGHTDYSSKFALYCAELALDDRHPFVVKGGATGIRTSQVTAPVRLSSMTVTGAGSVGIDLDDEDTP